MKKISKPEEINLKSYYDMDFIEIYPLLTYEVTEDGEQYFDLPKDRKVSDSSQRLNGMYLLRSDYIIKDRVLEIINYELKKGDVINVREYFHHIEDEIGYLKELLTDIPARIKYLESIQQLEGEAK